MAKTVTATIAAALALGLAGPAAGGEITPIGGVVAFPEGPSLVGDTLYFVEYAAHTIRAWDGATLSTVWTSEGCGPSAVEPIGESFLVTCYDNGTLVRLSKSFEQTAIWKADADGAALLGPNDVTPDGKGGAWFTASGPWEAEPIVGKVYHLAAGDAPPRMVADDLHYANGVALLADAGRLLVAESEAGRVISFAVAPDGALSDRRLFLRVAGVDPASGPFPYPDGLTVGPDGTIWIGQYSSGRVVQVTATAALVGVVEVPSPAAPNLVVAPDGSALYVTAVDDTSAAPYAGKVYRVALP